MKSSGNLDDAELKQLSEILEFCNIHSELKEAESEDISYLQNIAKKASLFRAGMKWLSLDSLYAEPSHFSVRSMSELIQKCKKALESFVDYHTHSDFVLSVVSSEEYKVLVKELTKLR